jgi:3-methyladenine DNA glycosylase AlkD
MPRRPTARAALARLRAAGDPVRAAHAQRYFKTGPGEYAEGDRFLGIRVPDVRMIAREFRALPLAELRRLIASGLHEARQLALVVLVAQYERGTEAERQAIYEMYLAHTAYINNWDLVDRSAPYIVGRHLMTRSRAPLARLARSKNLWERRIATLATFWMIREGEIGPAMQLATVLVDDEHELMHKAVGWMLREAAKRDQPAVERFQRRHQRTMPRTMLRYAIERFPAGIRANYLAGTA